MEMSPERFFDLFLIELEQRAEMHAYYKFLADSKSFHFRKNYFLERLRYIAQNVNDPTKLVWDCGCGYGTTALFLAMNGIKTKGTTLEFYFDIVQKRYEYWNQYGDASLFSCSYENLFDNPPASNSYDIIIVQDTLHHLEPINDALKIFNDSLKTNGKLVAIEENGNNIIQTAKLYKYRGNKRIINQWDEQLQKNILIGNENIRGLKTWTSLFEQNGFNIDSDSTQYVRFYLPFKYKGDNGLELLKKERELQKKSQFRKEYLFFGLNFIANKIK